MEKRIRKHDTDEQKAKRKLRSQTPEYKAKKKEYEQSKRGKELAKKRRQKPENRAKKIAYDKKPENIARRKIIDESPRRKAWKLSYDQRPENREKQRAHRADPEVKARTAKHDATPARKEKRRAFNAKYEKLPHRKAIKKAKEDAKRLKILQEYSQRLSNSNVPCCNCCGENSYIEFLDVDHILGKKEMDSIPELVAIGYSSKLVANKLKNWLIDNDFPEGFQILCKNCNGAKGLYGVCPHEKARKEEAFAMMEEQSSFEAGF